MIYLQEELFSYGNRKTFTQEATQAAFLLGGIGTGNVSLGSRGELRDWEIFNSQGKNNTLPNTFFAIRVKQEEKPPLARVLESKLQPPHALSHGYHPHSTAGLPRFESSTMSAEYPVVNINFEDSSMPVVVSLTAYTPFIPLNPEDSGIPGAYLTYTVRNITNKPVDVSVAGSIVNPIGAIKYSSFFNMTSANAGQNVNDYIEDPVFSGLFLHSKSYSRNDLQYGNLALTTTDVDVTYKRAWFRGEWFDYLQEFWDDFMEDGLLTDLRYNEEQVLTDQRDTGSIGICKTLLPGEEKVFHFVLTWYFPNRYYGWSEKMRLKEEGGEISQNNYANRFDSAWSVADYLIKHEKYLKEKTYIFKDSLYKSSLPDYVIDAVANNITVLRSTTCFWLKDGKFLGYEGCFDDKGSCDGSCTHVWNYAQTLAFLFPTLEQSMRKIEFLEELEEDGKMNFRAYTFTGCTWIWRGSIAPPAADGQMGSIMRVYREWKLSGDQAFLKSLWPSVKKALDYAFTYWDTDDDYVLDGAQHNTYDVEFYGPNPLTGLFFLGALKAAAQMAEALADYPYANKCKDAFEKSSKKLDELTWNGEYYIQSLEDVNEHKYQHGLGCLSDQMFAQQLAHLYGLGYLLPEEKVKSSLESIYKYNFKTDFSHHVNCQRTYALNDEKGLLLCSWPKGGRPRFPFVYSDEVWTGIEYQVAIHLLYEGFIQEGLTLVKAVRDRHDGIRRNPWNEVECGHHYARSMSSWGLIIVLSGFKFDMAKKEMSFSPIINQDQFTCFWSTGSAWGTYTQRRDADTGELIPKVEVLYGSVEGITVNSCDMKWTL